MSDPHVHDPAWWACSRCGRTICRRCLGGHDCADLLPGVTYATTRRQ